MDASARLERYHQLVHHYHQSLDIISEAGLAHFSDKLADAACYSDYIARQYPKQDATLLDIGSGVGLPAIPIAIALPQLRVHLVERRRKRSSFLKIVVSQLELSQVQVHTSDVQHLHLQSPVDIVTALAVGSFSYLHSMSQHLLAPGAQMLSRKGADSWQDELSSLPFAHRAQVLPLPASAEHASADGAAVLVAVQL